MTTCDLWILRRLPPPEITDRLLTDGERARRDAYLRPDDRQRFAAGTALARLAVGRHAGLAPDGIRFHRSCARCGDPHHGKPRAIGLDVHHSLSHSGQVVAVAVTDAAPVGVDVEARLPLDDAPRLMATVCDPSEGPVDDLEDLYVCWCRKEAVLKATGDGLSVPLTEVVVSPPGHAAALVSYRGQAVPFDLRDVRIAPGYTGAIAVRRGGHVDLVVRDGYDLLSPP